MQILDLKKFSGRFSTHQPLFLYLSDSEIAGEEQKCFFEATISFAFLHHKSATTCQIDSYKFSNSKMKPGLCNCVKTEIKESTAHPKQKHKRGTIFGDALHTTVSFPDFSYVNNQVCNLVPRVFLRHNLITKPNEHPGTLRSNAPRIWVH